MCGHGEVAKEGSKQGGKKNKYLETRYDCQVSVRFPEPL